MKPNESISKGSETYGEKELISTIDRLVSKVGAPGMTSETLRSLDQFHAGGAEAVTRVQDTLALSTWDAVLDVGSGFGGPARQIAVSSGCRVVGVDITPAYVDVAIELTQRCGLSDRVRFVLADIAEFEPGVRFDAGFTMHVQMNVEAKRSWFGDIARRLKPGARFAVWEVCRRSDAELSWPLPWSMDGSDSHVVTPGELSDAICGAGFEMTEWVDETQWVNTWFESTDAAGPAADPTLPMILDDGFTRVLNFAGALSDGTLEVWRGAFVRSSPESAMPLS
ncbi:MAG TPA: class I SAM-dependent methyltransferase [Acidimicrobiales bacterium]